jgi:LSD1 subclass zinc finger protein
MKTSDVDCPACGQRARVEVPAGSQEVRCPACQALVPVPVRPAADDLPIALLPVEPAPQVVPPAPPAAPAEEPRRPPRKKKRRRREEHPAEEVREEGLGVLLGVAAAGIGLALVTLLLLAKGGLEGWRPLIALGGGGASLALWFWSMAGLTSRRQRQRAREYDRIHARAREDALRIKGQAPDGPGSARHA